MIIGSLDRNRVRLEQPDLHLREILGHQPREVTAGAILGLALAALFNYDRLGRFGDFLQAVPKHIEMFVYLGVFVAIMLLGVGVRFVLRARYPKSKTIKQFTKRILTATLTVGWLGVLSVVLVYENASYFAWRLWPLLVLAVGLLWAWWIATASYKVVPEALAAEANEARKLKWLNWGAKRRKKRA